MTAKKKAARPMSKAEFKQCITSMGLSERGTAPVIGTSVRQTQRYAWGNSRVPAPVRKLMRLITRYGVPAEEVEQL